MKKLLTAELLRHVEQQRTKTDSKKSREHVRFQCSHRKLWFGREMGERVLVSLSLSLGAVETLPNEPV